MFPTQLLFVEFNGHTFSRHTFNHAGPFIGCPRSGRFWNLPYIKERGDKNRYSNQISALDSFKLRQIWEVERGV